MGEVPAVSSGIEGFAEGFLVHTAGEIEGTASTVKSVLES